MQITSSRTDPSALWQGVVWGTLLGAMLLVFNLVNSLGNLDTPGETWLKNGMLIVMILLPGLAGYMGSRETGRVKSGALTVLVTGCVSAIIGIITLWGITVIFMDTLRHNALTMIDFQQSGMTNMGVFIVEGALGGSVFLAVFSLAFGAGYGLLGSLLGAQYACLRTRQ
jgi:hypothetical protein